MIQITRGPEPAELPLFRSTQLSRLRALGREPRSDEIVGYRLIAKALWERQLHKCCYCEHRIMFNYHDVEHYRPKGRADRLPGCSLTHGYWWLAYSWNNLLYACPGCNRTGKNDRFPLNIGCSSIVAENVITGTELPLMLDPGANINPVEHIEFVMRPAKLSGETVYWWARPRAGSLLGNVSIDVCDLNRDELRETRNDYFATVLAPQVQALEFELAAASHGAVLLELRRALALLEPRNVYVAFSYDVFRAFIPDAKLFALVNECWPLPDLVGK